MKDRLLNLLQGAARRASSSLGRDSLAVRLARPLYESSLNFLAQDAGVPWKVNGEIYRVDSRYRHMIGPDYEPRVASFLGGHVQPGDVIFDVGANVGVYVLQLARWTKGRGKIVAFEPNPAARQVLERHITMNGLGAQVMTVASAVGEAPAERLLWASGEDGMARLEEPNVLLRDTAGSQSVTVTTLDSFAASSGLDPRWVLMDIEGYEIQALLGARALLQRLRGRIAFVIEMHPPIWASTGTPRPILEQFLRELRLEVRPIGGQSDPLGEYGHVLVT